MTAVGLAPCCAFTKSCHAVIHSLQSLQNHGECAAGSRGGGQLCDWEMASSAGWILGQWNGPTSMVWISCACTQLAATRAKALATAGHLRAWCLDATTDVTADICATHASAQRAGVCPAADHATRAVTCHIASARWRQSRCCGMPHTCFCEGQRGT